MNISALKTGAPLQAWINIEDDVDVLVNYLDRDSLMGLRKRATVMMEDEETGKMVEAIDPELLERETMLAAVADWRGLTDGEEDFPCSPENIMLLANRWSIFAGRIDRACVRLSEFVAAKQQETEKN